MKTRGYVLCMIVVVAFFAARHLSGTRAAMAFRASGSNSPVPAYEITDLGTLGASSSARAINNGGRVVGHFYLGGGMGATRHAFLWQDGTMHDLGSLPPKGSEAVDINDSGEIVGNAVAQNGQNLPILWKHGIIVQLETLAQGEFGSAAAINNAGQVIGVLRTDWVPRAVFWDDGEAIELSNLKEASGSLTSGINERGQIVGTSVTDSLDKAVLWEKDGSIIDLGIEGSAVAINNSGQIVVNGRAHAYLLDRDAIIDLELPGEVSGSASAINNSGQIVGTSDRAAVLWEDGKAYYLRDLIPRNSGWTQLTYAADINDRGQIVGTGVNSHGSRAFLMTPVRHQASGGGK